MQNSYNTYKVQYYKDIGIFRTGIMETKYNVLYDRGAQYRGRMNGVRENSPYKILYYTITISIYYYIMFIR